MLHPEKFAIARLEPDAPVPDFTGVRWYSITRTSSELSIVAPRDYFEQQGMACEEDWSCISCAQIFDLSLTGIAARITSALAEQKIPVFMIASYDTDHLLVPSHHADTAVRTLEGLDLSDLVS